MRWFAPEAAALNSEDRSMLNSHDDLEGALERLTAHLASPPRPGSPEDVEFQRLLNEIDAFNPSFTVPAEPSHLDQLAARAAELRAEAEALVRRRASEEPKGFAGLPKDGRGAGPTTGV